jgi:cytochrome c
MKKTHVLLILILLVFTFSCKNKKKENTKSTSTEIEVTTNDSSDVASNEETPKEIEEETEVAEADKKEEINTTIEKKIDKVKKTSNTAQETVKEVVVETTQEVNETVQEVTEEVTEVVEETTQEVNEIVQEVEEVVEEVVETPKPKPEPVQELTKAQKIAKGKILFNTGICKTCHDPKKKKIGPTLKEIGSKYKKSKSTSIAKFLKGNAKAIVWPDKFMMMKPNIDDVTSKMPKSDLDALEAYILSFAK